MSLKAYTGLLYLGYQLENHYLFDISLKNWLWVFILAPPTAAAMRYLSWPLAVPLSVLGTALFLETVWAKHRGFFTFRPASLGQDNRDYSPLQVDEVVCCRAYGTFAVGGRQRYLVNEEAALSYVRTREHVLMALVKPSRFLLVARSQRKEEGCWYVFFAPEHVRQVTEGYVACGRRTRPGLAIIYRPDDRADRSETVYIAFDDLDSLMRAHADLRMDAAARAFATHV